MVGVTYNMIGLCVPNNWLSARKRQHYILQLALGSLCAAICSAWVLSGTSLLVVGVTYNMIGLWVPNNWLSARKRQHYILQLALGSLCAAICSARVVSGTSLLVVGVTYNMIGLWVPNNLLSARKRQHYILQLALGSLCAAICSAGVLSGTSLLVVGVTYNMIGLCVPNNWLSACKREHYIMYYS